MKSVDLQSFVDKCAQIDTGPRTLFVYVPLPKALTTSLKATQKRVALKGDDQELDHITLVYIPDAMKDRSPKDIEGILTSLRKVTDVAKPIHAKIQGWGYFDGAMKDGEPKTALVALVDAPGLEDLHVALKKALKAKGVAPSDLHIYTAHFTFAYLKQGARVQNLPKLTGEFDINEVKVAADKVHTLALKGTVGAEAAEKAAGVRDALRVLATGRTSLFHGTNASRAAAIKAKGLLPQGASGVSSHLPGLGGSLAAQEAGLSFMTRGRGDAARYAKQQVGLDRFSRLKEFWAKHSLPGHKALAAAPPQVAMPFSPVLGGVPGGGKSVVEARIPWRDVAAREGIGKELHQNDALGLFQEMAADVPGVGKTLASGTAVPFTRHVPIKGTIPPSAIVGSPEYQRVTLPEVKRHVSTAVQEPRAFGKEVMRAALGRQHRPSTLMAQAPVEKAAAVNSDDFNTMDTRGVSPPPGDVYPPFPAEPAPVVEPELVPEDEEGLLRTDAVPDALENLIKARLALEPAKSIIPIPWDEKSPSALPEPRGEVEPALPLPPGAKKFAYNLDGHAALTDRALDALTAEGHRFTPEQRVRLIQANKEVDKENARGLMLSKKRSPFHYHAGEEEQSQQLIDDYYQRALQDNTTEGALDALGIALHTTQDEFSHAKHDVPPGVRGLVTHIPGLPRFMGGRHSPDSMEKYPELADEAAGASQDLLGRFMREREGGLGVVGDRPLQHKAKLEDPVPAPAPQLMPAPSLGRVAAMKIADLLPGGVGDDKSKKLFDPEEYAKGLKVEREHTDSDAVAAEITGDHLTDNEDYYTELDGAGLAHELHE